MPPWWKRLPTRLLDEEKALVKLEEGDSPLLASHRWETNAAGELVLLAQLQVASKTMQVEVRFSPHYPEECPSVRPVPYDTRISSHQFVRSGILCLELGPDNWHPRYMAADMISSAWRLVALEKINACEPIEIPSRHEPTLAEQVAGSVVLLRSDDFNRRAADALESTEFELRWLIDNGSQLLPISFPKDIPLSSPPALPEGGTLMRGQFVTLYGDAPEPGQVPEDLKDFVEYVRSYSDVELGDGTRVVLLRWPGGETRGYIKSQSGILKLTNMPLATGHGSRISNTLETALAGIRVGIIGLGSLGSKIAVSLARSGTRRFVFVDGDVMQGGNVCRHQGTYRDVGTMKALATKKLVRAVSAEEPEIETYTFDLGAATNPELHARVTADLAACDVIVDATANAEVFGIAAGLTSDHRRALVWAEVFAGGLGGLIASAHPERDPCPRCVRAGFLDVAASWPRAPHLRTVEPYGSDEDAALVATDADVSLVAAAATNRICDLVVGEPHAQPSVMLLGLRPGWIFETPMQSVAVPVRSDDSSCDRCWTEAAEADPSAAAKAERLLANNVDAHDPSPK